MEQEFQAIQNWLILNSMPATQAGVIGLAKTSLGVSDEALAEFFGSGPLADLLGDEDITEILVNGPKEIWFEKSGTLFRHSSTFYNDESLRRYVRRILSTHGKKIDHRTPFVDASLEDGSRVHVVSNPISKRGLCLSIRRFRKVPWNLEALFHAGSLSVVALRYLSEAVLSRKNIFVSGGTGSGKTSLLSALISEVGHSERIVALEDVAEIRTSHPHFLSLECRTENQEGEGAVSLRRLLRESLRMRPDRIIIGECRGQEAMDLLLALNTGHRGSMGTIHANSPREALSRLETLALLSAENATEDAVKSLVASSMNVIVQLERGKKGREISAISELKGIDSGKYLLKEIKLV